MRVDVYTDADAATWDALVADAPMGTLLHTRRYLSYHGDRFADRSLLIHDDERLIAVLPAALDPDDPSVVVSHPGVTYGGLVHTGALTGGPALDALAAVQAFFAAAGASSLVYKAVPSVYHRRPSLDDRYALWHAGARLSRVDLSTAIDLSDPGRRGSRRTRGLKRARKEGLEVRTGREQAAPLWPVLAAVLGARHGVRPVHTLEEILLLQDRFPEEIDFITGWLDDELVAGVVLFKTPSTHHAQYIAAADRGTAVGALDLLFAHCIEAATAAKARYFNFGISTEEAGRVLNRGLHAFKADFGGGGVVHEVFDLPLAHERQP